MADTGKDYISNSADPKSIQDLTSFVSKTCSTISLCQAGITPDILFEPCVASFCEIEYGPENLSKLVEI